MLSKQPRSEIYETTKNAIDECLKQFNGLTNSLNEVCNQASLLGRSLTALEDMTFPENVGDEQVKKFSTRKLKYSAPLNDALDTFSKWELRKLFIIPKLTDTLFDSQNSDHVLGENQEWSNWQLRQLYHPSNFTNRRWNQSCSWTQQVGQSIPLISFHLNTSTLQSNHQRVPRVLLQPLQSFHNLGSRVDGEVLDLQ